MDKAKPVALEMKEKDWNWIINTIYFSLALYKSFLVYKERPVGRFLNSAAFGFFALIQPISWLVSVVFWALLAPAAVFHNPNAFDRNTCVVSHTINLIFPLIEIAISTVDLSFIHLWVPCLGVTIYSFAIIIVHAATGMDWPYPFLDALNGGPSGISWGPMLAFLAGLFVFLAIFLGITLLFIKQRNRHGKKRLARIEKESSNVTV
ncbi:hypothetical protein HK103_001485 [Boothiomyces macroporosus]|uniref:Uncharacterized protein n=1 Tax=Boothiomyces macroporosus TaxID=261099 RepID=A0AAD5UJP5_9FUNG|nr:hypothetical protein HK103_001485 [Boothiomyces macroporosus]